MRGPMFRSAVLMAFAALTVGAVPASGSVVRAQASSDASFVDRMIARLTGELELARTAATASQLPALQSFARAVIAEREDQLNDLAAMRSRLAGGGTAAAERTSSSGPAATGASAGGGSDRAMIDEFIRRHHEVIQLAKTQAAAGKDAELNTFARRLTYSMSADIPELQQLRAAIPGTGEQE